MKINFRYICSVLCFVMMLFTFGACEDIMETDSDRYDFEDDNTLDRASDSLYSVMGILSQVQKIGDRYIIFGELRGDLMTVSDDASISLKEINAFNMTSDNAYAEKYDYYSIINNCNYAISRMDTSIFIKNEQVMLPEFVAIKCIRAWTYLQMAQIYGKVIYLEKPILDLESAQAEYSPIDMDELARLLINDLTPYIGVRHLNYGTIDDQQSSQFFIPIRMLLGDLYLYLNQYDQAASMYHDLMYENNYVISNSYTNTWTNTAWDGASVSHTNAYYDEVITKIAYSSAVKDFHSNMVKMSYSDNAALLPVQNFVDEMSIATFFFALYPTSTAITGYTEGDLRGTIRVPKTRVELGDAYETVITGSKGEMNLIKKYLNASIEKNNAYDPDNNLLKTLRILTSLPIYRQPQLYLRYAEAVNRAGKPTLAFAVLKYGLNKEKVARPEMVNQSELANNEPYVNFESSVFDPNVGTASRGRGYGVPLDKTYFVIPNFTKTVPVEDGHGNIIMEPSTDPADIAAAHQDSVSWIELRILDEMAAETAFEGNRFFDLLRISRHRDNHPEFMAEKVALKYANPEEMKNRLMNINNWFMK